MWLTCKRGCHLCTRLGFLVQHPGPCINPSGPCLNQAGDMKEKGKHKSKEKKHKSKDKTKGHRSKSDRKDEGPQQQLERERAAVSALRSILCLYPNVRKDLREMLWNVDQGKAADVSGIPDEDLRSKVNELLQLLQLQRTSKGIYGLPKNTSSTLSIVGFVFDEPSSVLEAHRVATAASKVISKPAAATAAAAAAAHDDDKEAALHKRNIASNGAGTSSSSSDDERDVLASPTGMQQEPAHYRAAPEAAAQAVGAQSKRVAGPAAPPPELLAAAAAAAAEMAAMEEEVAAARAADEDLLVGPVPPELIEEADAAPQDEREAEVMRIMSILKEARHEQQQQQLPQPPPSTGASHALTADPYAVLGVSKDAAPGEIKRRYMRLSLLIHPDKCHHKDANTAFQAVASAAKLLQDTELRKEVDERQEDAALRKAAAVMAAQQEREQQWRVVRGEEPADGPPGSLTHPMQPPQREAWMTELPPERRPVDIMNLSQTSQRAFSRTIRQGRGDTSVWTDSPLDRLAKEAQGLLQQAEGPLAITSGAIGPSAATSVAASMLDKFNADARSKSLLEKHMEQQQASKERKSKKQKTAHGGAAAPQEDWVGKHPWKPWDREKDLEIKPVTLQPTELLKKVGGLNSMFNSAGGSRHFL